MIINKLDGMIRNVNGKNFIIPVKNEYAKRGAFFEVNSVGCNIWKLIDKETNITKEDLILKISDFYSVERDIIETDLHEFISELENKKLVEISK